MIVTPLVTSSKKKHRPSLGANIHHNNPSSCLRRQVDVFFCWMLLGEILRLCQTFLWISDLETYSPALVFLLKFRFFC